MAERYSNSLPYFCGIQNRYNELVFPFTVQSCCAANQRFIELLSHRDTNIICDRSCGVDYGSHTLAWSKAPYFAKTGEF